MYLDYKSINAEQKKGIDYKIQSAIDAITAGFAVSKHNCGLAFSGGKDSTVLWHLVRTHFPDKPVHIIFGNTGVEFPESLAFARKLGAEWGGEYFHEATPEKTDAEGLKYEAQQAVLNWLIDNGTVQSVLKEDGKLKSTAALEKACPPDMLAYFRDNKLTWPQGTTQNYWWCVDQYGYPILGKAASKLTARRINIDCFLRFSTSASDDEELLTYYGMLKNVKMSNHCCAILKKEPSERVQAELDIDVIFKGLMAAESRMRRLNFASRGYLFESSRPHLGSDSFYHCNPLQIWRDEDIWEYIHKFDVPYSSLYDVTYFDHDKKERHIARNGCMPCATDIAFKNSHLAALRKTHPNAWEVFMRKGLGQELQQLHKFKSDGFPTRINQFSFESIMSDRPCAFDEVGRYIIHDDLTDSDYDSELE